MILPPNKSQPSAVGVVSSAVVVHAAAWPRRLVASLRRPFPNLPRRLGRLPRRSVSLAEWPGHLPERFRKPAIYLPILDKHVPNQQLASLNPFQTSNLN